VVSLTLTPVMCSLFLKPHGEYHPGRLNRLAERGFSALLSGYDRGLRFVLRHQPSMLVATLGLMALTGYLYVTIPKGFFPQQDTGFIFGQVQGREDASFENMAGIAHQIAAIVAEDPAVQGVFYLAGTYAYNPTEDAARMFMQLKPHDQREVTADQVIQRLRPKIHCLQSGIAGQNCLERRHHCDGIDKKTIAIKNAGCATKSEVVSRPCQTGSKVRA